MSQDYHYQVSEQDAGKRLDLYLAFNLPEFSRSYIKENINAEKVKVNGEVEFHPQYRIKQGDEIAVDIEQKQKVDSKIRPTKIDIDVIYEDDNLLALNKHTGIVVHPAAGHFDDTLANAVKYYLESKGENNWGIDRAGLVHRLDAPTSGVIIFAKTPQALWHLSKQFADREVKKTYLALVQGRIGGKLVLTDALGRDRVNRKKISSRTNKPRRALTEVFPIAYSTDGKFTLVKALPQTGRTHQIRVHLSEAGHKIVGDGIYGNIRNKRLMLHAYILRLKPKVDSEETIEIKAPLDQDFLSTLEKYKFKDLKHVKDLIP